MQTSDLTTSLQAAHFISMFTKADFKLYAGPVCKTSLQTYLPFYPVCAALLSLL